MLQFALWLVFFALGGGSSSAGATVSDNCKCGCSDSYGAGAWVKGADNTVDVGICSFISLEDCGGRTGMIKLALGLDL